MQRQMLPSSAALISSSDGSGFSRSRAQAERIMPGVQKPHSNPPSSQNASCTGCNSFLLPSPSMVTSERPWTSWARVAQALRGRPSSSTVQAPHTSTSQLVLTPRSPSERRRKSDSNSSGATAARCGAPFNSNRISIWSMGSSMRGQGDRPRLYAPETPS